MTILTSSIRTLVIVLSKVTYVNSLSALRTHELFRIRVLNETFGSLNFFFRKFRLNLRIVFQVNIFTLILVSHIISTFTRCFMN